MKYTVIDLASKTRSAAVIGLFCIASHLQAATILQKWDFDDASGTAINATVNSVSGGSSWSAAIPGVTTTGAGSLLIAYTNESTSTRITAPIATISSGIVQLDIALSGWDITGYNQTANFAPLFRVGLASSSSSTLVANIWLSPTPSGFTISGVGPASANDTPSAQTQTLAGGLARNTPVTLRLTADFDARTYSVSNSDTGYTTLSTGTLPATNATFLNFRVLDNFTTAGSGVGVDSITFSSVPEPSSVALLGLAASAFIYRRKSRRLAVRGA